ncbi:hypothetical protein EVJ58_g7905 [Rhodofomes roseus]|uniref:Uncharacterized protein n=1 Tax=Rhodofomes roseus TaxID=34475 RepID=A0A4Y9Y0P0_9APHY|nr:hypothetical protein EVJ58_g7905 [Rhodofomes roseus]
MPSPNGLTENWSPIASAAPLKSSSSSSSEEGPEDLSGYGAARQVKTRLKGDGEQNTEDRRKQARSKGRQSSVHDLVDLWGGVGEKEKEPAAKSATTSTTSSRVADASKRRPTVEHGPSTKSAQEAALRRTVVWVAHAGNTNGHGVLDAPADVRALPSPVDVHHLSLQDCALIPATWALSIPGTHHRRHRRERALAPA